MNFANYFWHSKQKLAIFENFPLSCKKILSADFEVHESSRHLGLEISRQGQLLHLDDTIKRLATSRRLTFAFSRRLIRALHLADGKVVQLLDKIRQFMDKRNAILGLARLVFCPTFGQKQP